MTTCRCDLRQKLIKIVFGLWLYFPLNFWEIKLFLRYPTNTYLISHVPAKCSANCLGDNDTQIQVTVPL